MFLKPMNRLLLILGVLVLTTSCSEYQKVLKGEDIGTKYATAEQLYNEAEAGEGNSKRKYRKALRLFEQIVPEYRGRPQAQKLMFLYANTYYQLGDYFLSGYQFERFTESYPDSERLEEAAYKGAKSYYFLSPRYSLDQTETHQALDKMQAFLNRFPQTEHIEEANEIVTELRVKLERKDYEIAKQYHHTEDYNAAMTSFNNFLLDNPGSPYREQAYYYRFDSAYIYAVNSYMHIMGDRLATARGYYQDYVRYFPEGEFIEEANQALAEIEEWENRLANREELANTQD